MLALGVARIVVVLGWHGQCVQKKCRKLAFPQFTRLNHDATILAVKQADCQPKPSGC
jgi:hypothetical protein